MEQTNIQDDGPKWHYVLSGQVYGGGRWKEGDVVELLPAQAAGYIGQAISKGYASESGALKAAEPKTEKVSASKTDAKDSE